MARRMEDPRPVLEAFGPVMVASVQKNFDVGGRPVFKPLRPMSLRGPRRGGPIYKTGNLRGSTGFAVERNDLVVGQSPNPGIKGPVHQYGARTSRAVIPDRPSLVFQDEDMEKFTDMLGAHIEGGGAR